MQSADSLRIALGSESENQVNQGKLRVGTIQILPETWQKIFLQTLCKSNDGGFGNSVYCDEMGIIGSLIRKNFDFTISYEDGDDTAGLVAELFEQRLIEQPGRASNGLVITERGRELCRRFEAEHFRESLIAKLSVKPA